jgi:obg-like ATPase 1
MQKTSTLGAQLLFSSPLLTFTRSAASTATSTKSLLSCTVYITTTRNYAKKPNRMPPKKAVKEEKLLLGRPGNSLKSGIVCSFSPTL